MVNPCGNGQVYVPPKTPTEAGSCVDAPKVSSKPIFPAVDVNPEGLFAAVKIDSGSSVLNELKKTELHSADPTQAVVSNPVTANKPFGQNVVVPPAPATNPVTDPPVDVMPERNYKMTIGGGADGSPTYISPGRSTQKPRLEDEAPKSHEVTNNGITRTEIY